MAELGGGGAELSLEAEMVVLRPGIQLPPPPPLPLAALYGSIVAFQAVVPATSFNNANHPQV